MSEFLEDYVRWQVERVKQIGDHITNLERVGPGHGEYHFDDELH